jgi:hypothetical protein
MAAFDFLATAIQDNFKEWYSVEQRLKSLLERTDPFFQKIKFAAIGGANYKLPWLVHSGGAMSSDFVIAAAMASHSVSIKTAAVTPGTMFSAFVLNPLEAQASAKSMGAFEDIAVARMHGSSDMLRKGIATSIYSRGYHELGLTVANAAGGSTDVEVDASTAIKMDIGGSELTGCPYEVESITEKPDTGTYLVTFTEALDVDCPAGYVLTFDGNLDSSSNLRSFMGLDGWIPTLDNRVSAAWTTYVNTSFYGVTRSTYPSRYCGAFHAQKAGENKSKAVISSMRKTRRGGGINDLILMNDEDYQAMMDDIAITAFKYAQGAGSGQKPELAFGASQYKFGFSKSWIEDVYDSPYCNKGKGWCLDLDSWKFVAMSHTGELFTGSPANNNNGAPEPKDAATVPTNYAMLAGDWISTSPSDTTEGQGIRVALNVYGNFVCDLPAHNGAFTFTAGA